MKYSIRILNNTDEEIINNFYKNDPPVNGLHFYLKRTPSFFEALEIEGSDPLILSVFDLEQQKVVGALIRSIRECYINGIETRIGYVGSTKIEESLRRGWLLGKLLNSFHELINKEPRLYFCSILSSNKTAIKIFSSGRNSLPLFREIGVFNTHLFKPCKRVKINCTGFDIVNANNLNINDLISYLQTEGAERQFFPVYKKEHFLNNKKGLLKDLDLNSIYVAVKNNEIIGLLGVWDQSIFRQWILANNKKSVRFFRPLLNLYAKIRKIPGIPGVNEKINYKYLSLVCIKNNDSKVFEALLHQAVNNEYERNKDCFLAIGFLENDPLFKHFNLPSFVLKSVLYLFAWKENSQYLNSVELKNCYIELGAL